MGLCFTKQTNEDSLNSTKVGCCAYSDFERRVYPIIDNLDISAFRKNIIRKRYVKLVLNYEAQYDVTHYRYNLCRILISVGSMMLPTLQTIQNNENVASIKDEIFWSAIGTSLTVMICNNIISMFTLDRRYIMYAVTCEKLKSIGWQYFEESGMFANSSHSDNYVKFWNEIEKTIKLQIMSEFSSDDKHGKDDEFDTLEPSNKLKLDDDNMSNKEYPLSPPLNNSQNYPLSPPQQPQYNPTQQPNQQPQYNPTQQTNQQPQYNPTQQPNQQSQYIPTQQPNQQSEYIPTQQPNLQPEYNKPQEYIQKFENTFFENEFIDKSLNTITNAKEQFDVENQIAPLSKEISKIDTEVVLEKIQDEVLEKKNQ